MRVKRIPLDRINPSPYNVRQGIDVGGLTCSIERTGQIEPLRLRPVEEAFEIRTGMRRFLALKAAGATHADAIVVEGTDDEVISEQWNENEERANYTDYERALKLRQMLDALGLTQKELAEKIGKDPSWVSRHLAMLKLEELPMGNLSELNERQARTILDAPEEDWPALAQYVEVYFEEQGNAPPSSNLAEYAREVSIAREFENRRRLLVEEGEPAPVADPEHAEEHTPEAFIEEHNLSWVFDPENSNSTGLLTKIATLSAEELEFCLAHETRPLNIQRLNEEMERREPDQPAKRPLLKEPPTTSAQVIATINRIVGEPAEGLQAKLMDEHGLSEEEAQAALQAYRETYPDIWDRCYAEKSEDEEPMTAEQYVADVLTHNPEVGHEELARVTADMFGVSEGDAQNLIERIGKRRGRKPRDPYATRSPVTICPLCGRGNAEMNKILMVLEAYQAQPRVTVVDWLKEVLA